MLDLRGSIPTVIFITDGKYHDSNLLDEIVPQPDAIQLKGPESKQLYPDTLRMVEYYDDEKDLLLTLITNNFEVSPPGFAGLYLNRWQIEVFFKWIKQNLTIKTLWGHSGNAVKVHVWIAICTYLIVAQAKYALGRTLSSY